MNRREFIASGGALIVSFALPAFAQKLPGALERQPMLDAWLRVAADGRITVFTGKAELGQGIKTAILQIAAEQLGVPMSSIELVTADTARTPNEGYTAGSNSMKDSGTAILHASAQARDVLIAEAAKRWGVPPEQVTAQGGELRGPEGKRMSYGAAVTGELLHVRAQAQSNLSKTRSVMGKPVQRVDIPAKVTGGAAYVHDLRLPDMLHARVVRPPSYGARLTAVEVEPVAKMAGVVKIVRDGSFLAVVAAREWSAVQALRALRARAKWEETRKLPRDIYATLPQLKSEDTVIAGADTQLPQGTRVIEAEYRRPFQIHGAIGPACAVARYEGDALTVWTHSQGVFPLRGALAELMSMPQERIHCIQMEGSGCYGHNAADDVAADAALIARQVPGKPIRVQWMREDEHAWEPFGAAMIGKTRATLDGSGKVSGWQYDLWSNTHST
jgi:CO/xanthine dehydrogenase Mo-binding subunit